MRWLEVIMGGDKLVNRSYFVRRNFLIGDKVNAYFKGEFYGGVVVDKKLEDSELSILVKTKKKVGDKGDLFGGFGLYAPFPGRDPIFFENEPLPNGDQTYRKKIEWPMTQEEIKIANEPLPF